MSVDTIKSDNCVYYFQVQGHHIVAWKASVGKFAHVVLPFKFLACCGNGTFFTASLAAVILNNGTI